MPTKRDIIEELASLLARIIGVIKAEQQKEGNGDNDENAALTSILRRAESMQDTLAVMKKYRELRNRSLYLFYPESDEYVEATKSTRMKIARRLLLQEGLIQ